MGITTNIEDYVVFDQNNPLIRFITNDTVLTVVKSVFGVAIVLVILFTIFSIIVSEYNKAANDEEYSVKRIWGRAFKSIFGMAAFPIIFIACILLLNSVLAGFAAALSSGRSTTVSGQLFATSAYEANVYRNYANNNARVPIALNFTDPYDEGTANRYTKVELAAEYKKFQSDGIQLYNMFADNSFNSWQNSVTYNYRNNSLSNNSGKYNSYEKFVCTAEQYQVMADFVDYAVASNLKFYYKPITDSDIEWKYVDEAIFNKETYSLSITYSDTNDINEDESDGNKYTVTYQPASYNLSTPIEDALNTLSALLSLNGQNYMATERDDGALNSLNFTTDKVFVKLSDSYTDPTRWTLTDQIILLEYYRWDYNNTFGEYNLTNLEDGIYLDLYNVSLQYHRTYSNSWVDLVLGWDSEGNAITSVPCALINGNYYLVEQSGQTDSSGNPIYRLKSFVPALDEDGNVITDINGNEQPAVNQNLLNEVTSWNENNPDRRPIGIAFDCLQTAEGNPRYFSAAYTVEGLELANSTLQPAMLNTTGEAFVNNGGTTSYGYPDANGIYHSVERPFVEVSTRKVSWPTKFVGDLNTIYYNLNLSQLITTGEWLTSFTSNKTIGQLAGEYVSSFDTSLISPQGLILSELFLNTIRNSDRSTLGEYMFVSSLSDMEIRALMLSLLGEGKYETISTSLTYFLDTFNMLFEPLLEKIMDGENNMFTQGEVTSVQLYTYKAYLASLLLSDDAAKFFLEMVQKIIAMNKFGYDVLYVQPNDRITASNIIDEYCDTRFGEGKIPYSFELKAHNIDMSSFGYVWNADAGVWQETETSDRSSLIDAINDVAGSQYYSLADIIILENLQNDDYYYGFDLAKLDASVGHTRGGAFTYIFDGTNYSLTYNKQTGKITGSDGSLYHSPKQLPGYSQMSSAIYTEVSRQLKAGQAECFAVDVYLSVKEQLNGQYITEGSSSWPVYMTVFRGYLLGNLNRLDILLSADVTTGDVRSLLTDYDLFNRSFNKASSNLVNQIWQIIKLEHSISDQLEEDLDYNFTKFIDNYYDAAARAGAVVGEDAVYDGDYNGYNFKLYLDKLELNGLIFEQLNWPFVESVYVNTNTLDGYRKFKLVDEQIKDIIEYANSQFAVDDFGNLYTDKNSRGNWVLSSGGKSTNLIDYNNADKDGNVKYTWDGSKLNFAEVQGLQQVANAFNNYSYYQDLMDSFNKYYITYALRMQSSESISKTFNVVINNHSYSMDIKMPTAQLAEYVLGAVYMDAIGYDYVYISEGYTGFFDLKYNLDGSLPELNEDVASFKVINKFLEEIATTTIQSYYLSNLLNLTSANKQDASLLELAYTTNGGASYGASSYYIESSLDGQHVLPSNSSVSSYLKLILQSIASNRFLTPEQLVNTVVNISYIATARDNASRAGDSIAADQISALSRFITSDEKNVVDDDAYSTVYPGSSAIINAAGNTMQKTGFYNAVYNYIEYLDLETTALGFSQTKYAFNNVVNYLLATGNTDYSGYTPKQFRLALMDCLLNYVSYSDETTLNNQQRYLSIFKLFCSDFVDVDTGFMDVAGKVHSVSFMVHEDTKNLVLKLCGLQDKADEFLVGLEYSDLAGSYDENNGDVFVICTLDYQSQRYIPFMMNSDGNTDKANFIKAEDGTTWLDYGFGAASTTYYQGYSIYERGVKVRSVNSFPIIARGVISDDGYPTAIRVKGDDVEFYRSDLTIRNASEINLNEYFLTIDESSVNYNFFSAMFNGVYKIFHGKSFVEQVYGNTPRYSIDSSFDVPIGVNTTSYTLNGNGVELGYSLNSLNGLSAGQFYDVQHLNYLVLLIGLLALFPIMIKALWGVFGRVLDLTIYYMLSPAMFATIALGKDVKEKDKTVEKTPMYTNWMNELIKKTLSVFGFVIGFQAFFLLVPFISSMTVFTNAAAYQAIPLFRHISAGFVNGVIRLLFIICSAYLINSAPQLLSEMLGQYNSIEQGAQVHKNVQGTINDVKTTLSGKKLVDKVNYAEQVIKDATGITAMQNIKGKVRKMGAKVAAKGAEYYARAHGVPKEVAKQATQQMYQAIKQEEDTKRALREERRLKNYDNFGQDVGADYTNTATDAGAKHIADMEAVNKALSNYQLTDKKGNKNPIRKYDKKAWKKEKDRRKKK